MVSAEILNSHPLSTLKKEISKTNIKGYSRMKKPELVATMMKHKERFGHIKHSGKTARVAKAPAKEPKKKIPFKVKEKKPATPKAATPKAATPKEKTPTPKSPTQNKIIQILLALPKITNSRKGAEALAKKLPAFRLREGTGNSSSGEYFYTERRINGQQYTINLRTLAKAQKLAKTDPQKVIDDPFPDNENIMRLNKMLKFKMTDKDVPNPIEYPSKSEAPTPKVDTKKDEELMAKYKALKKAGGVWFNGAVSFTNGKMNVNFEQYDHEGTKKDLDPDRKAFTMRDVEDVAKKIGAGLGTIKMKEEEKVKGATSYPVLEYERLGMGKSSKDLRRLKDRTWQLKGKKVIDKWNQKDAPAYYLKPEEFKKGYGAKIQQEVGDRMTFTADKGKNRIRDSRLYMLDPKKGFIEIPS